MTTTPQAPLSEEEFAAFENWANEGGMLPPPHKMRDQLRRIAAELRTYRATAQGDDVGKAEWFLATFSMVEGFEPAKSQLLGLLASVRADEREKCAKVAIEKAVMTGFPNGLMAETVRAVEIAVKLTGQEIAAAIRTRGQGG